MSFIKDVILSFEAKISGNGFRGVKNQLNDIDKTADKAFDSIQKNIQDYEKSLQAAANKKLDLKGIDNLINKVKATEDEIKKLDKDFSKLSDSQKQAVAKVSLEIENQIRTLNKQRNEIVKSGEAQTVSVRNFSNAINGLLPILGNYGNGISRVVGSIGEYVTASGEAEKKTTSLGSSLDLLKSKWGVIAGATAAAGAALATYFKQTTEGSEGLKIFGDSIGLQIDNILSNLGAKVQKILKGDFKGAFTGGLLTLRDADAQAIARSGIELQKQINFLSKINAEKQISIEKDRELISQQATKLDEVNNQIVALQRVRVTDNEIDDNNVKIAQLKYDQLKKELSIKAELLPVDRERLNNAEIEVLRAKSAAEAGDRLFNKLSKGLENNKQSIIKSFNDLLKGLSDSVDDFEFQDSFNKILNLGGTDFDRAKLAKDLEKVAEGLNDKIQELKDKQGGGLNVPVELQINTDEAITKLLEFANKLNDINEQIRKDIADHPIEFLPTRGGDNVPVLDLKIDQTAKKIQEKAKTIEEILREVSESSSKLFGSISDFESQENKKTDILIEQQQKRVDESLKIAAAGNAEQLQLEEERLNTLIQKREAAARRQAQIDSIQKLSSTGLAVAEFVAGAANAFKTNPFAAVIEIGALVASVIAGISSLKNASGFYEGTEYLTKNGNGKTRHPKDNIPVYLAEGERIVPNFINDKLSGIPNSALPELARIYRGNIFNVSSGGSKADNETINALRNQNELMGETIDAIKELSINVGFDGEQFYVRQKRTARQRNRISNLKR